jgi:hypothetical protein
VFDAETVQFRPVDTIYEYSYPMAPPMWAYAFIDSDRESSMTLVEAVRVAEGLAKQGIRCGMFHAKGGDLFIDSSLQPELDETSWVARFSAHLGRLCDTTEARFYDRMGRDLFPVRTTAWPEFEADRQFRAGVPIAG